jgi:hypothetical protein
MSNWTEAILVGFVAAWAVALVDVLWKILGVLKTIKNGLDDTNLQLRGAYGTLGAVPTLGVIYETLYEMKDRDDRTEVNQHLSRISETLDDIKNGVDTQKREG